MKQFQELYPELDDENLFKKPKSRVGVCIACGDYSGEGGSGRDIL